MLRLVSRLPTYSFTWRRNATCREKMSADSRQSLIKSSWEMCAAALASISPDKLVRSNLRVVRSGDEEDQMYVGDNVYPLNRNVKVVAFGKAVLGMSEALEELLGDHIVSGVASVPVGSISNSTKLHKIKIMEGAANNLPCQASHKAALEILRICLSALEGEIVVAVISGGGSALLPCPIEGVKLEEKRKAIELLAKAGANIHELNMFRKFFSKTKGGKLAEAAHPAQMVGLILSDVIGDPLDIIASGPTVPSDKSSTQIISILEKYNLLASMPNPIQDVLPAGEISSVESSKTVPILDGWYEHVHNVIVGNNRIATSAVEDKAKCMGYYPIVWSHAVQGEARLLGEMYAELAQCISKYGARSAVVELKKTSSFLSLIQSCSDMAKEIDSLGDVLSDFEEIIEGSPYGLCLISGGEPTVTVRGGGKGGRNQELALSFSLAHHHLNQQTHQEERHDRGCDCVMVSLATDGQDGPTDAAGAIGHASLITTAISKGLNAKQFLEENDSYTFFSQLDRGKYLLKTGLTGTNVMDIHILLFGKDHNSPL